MIQSTSLEHHLLIAMPSLDGTWFEKTLIYIVEDTEDGTMGLTLTQPHAFNVEELLDHFELDLEPELPYLNDKVLIGGPVDMEHGFVLHEDTGTLWQKSMPLSGGLAMSVSEDLLKAIAKGTGPRRFLTCLGFAGWENGQLADEIKSNSWLTIPYNDSLVFDLPFEDKWKVALKTLGIAPEFLSMEAGHG